MLPANLVVLVCLGYVMILFAVAFAGDRRARKDPGGWLSSPLVYTLSISIYCTSWTFFGAVGSAARTGLEFVTIYLGPTIVFVGWWIFLRKLVTIGRIYHTTSIADLISARFGKSPALGALVTIVALVATAPYIALQLKALTASYQVITFHAGAVTGRRRPPARQGRAGGRDGVVDFGFGCGRTEPELFLGRGLDHGNAVGRVAELAGDED